MINLTLSIYIKYVKKNITQKIEKLNVFKPLKLSHFLFPLLMTAKT